jgi:hypothetical protein
LGKEVQIRSITQALSKDSGKLYEWNYSIWLTLKEEVNVAAVPEGLTIST